MAKYKLGERKGADIFQALCSWPEEVVKMGKWSIGKRSLALIWGIWICFIDVENTVWEFCLLQIYPNSFQDLLVRIWGYIWLPCNEGRWLVYVWVWVCVYGGCRVLHCLVLLFIKMSSCSSGLNLHLSYQPELRSCSSVWQWLRERMGKGCPGCAGSLPGGLQVGLCMKHRYSEAIPTRWICIQIM